MTAPEIAVLGEALMDVVETGDDEPRLARPGGSPYNVAIGLARLGRVSAWVGRVSRDPLGQLLWRHAERSAVDLSWCLRTDDPSTVALVTLDGHGVAQYSFGITGTADFRFTAAELAVVADDVPAVHFGSLTSWLPPGDAAVVDRVRALRSRGAAVSYDPNVRPRLQPDRDAARAQVEAGVAIAHLVKTSAEDLAWTHPGRTLADVAAEWLTRGPAVVVVTDGDRGATAYTAGATRTCTPPAVDVIDTVGAGDAFMSGLLDALIRRHLLAPAALAGLAEEASALAAVLDDAAQVAALTCARAGANPPRAAELGR